MVEDPLRLRVAGVVHLEAAVQQHPVDDVGADPAAHGVARLAHDDLDARRPEVPRAGQPGQPCPDHHDLRHPGSVGVEKRSGRSTVWETPPR